MENLMMTADEFVESMSPSFPVKKQEVRAYQKAAQSALDVQDACNLSGILHSLTGDVTAAIRTEAERLGKGTTWVNRHPIIAMYLFKLGELNGYGITSLDEGYAKAELECKAIAEGGGY